MTTTSRPTWDTVLAPTDQPTPALWRGGALVAAVVVLVSVAGTGYVTDLASRVLEVGAGGGLGGASSLLAPLLGLLAALVAAGLVLLALRHPWPALVVACAPVLLSLPLGISVPVAVPVLLAGVSAAAAWRRPVVSVTATALALLTLGAGVVVSSPLGAFEQLVYTDRAAVLVVYGVGLCGLLALVLAARHQVLASRDSELRLAARSAEVEEQSEVTTERARLARDLHDVVAHHVSLIAVRAETAPYTHPGLGHEARTVLSEIASDARRALDELRGVLGILGRSLDDDRVPQPSWGDIGSLVERASSSGERVTLAGDARAEVDPTVGYVAYRVVQEGLTNARKHAPGAGVTVRLERTPHLAVVSVATTAPARGDVELTAPLTVGVHQGPSSQGFSSEGSSPGSSAGHGLVGMRERVESLGGRLVAGRRDGGFVVEATLPLEAGART